MDRPWATVGCLRQKGQRTVGIVSVSSSPRTVLKNKALDTEANEDDPGGRQESRS